MDRILIEYQKAYDEAAKTAQNKIIGESAILQLMLKHAFLRLCLNNEIIDVDYYHNTVSAIEFYTLSLEELAEMVLNVPFQYYIMKQNRHLCKFMELFYIKFHKNMQEIFTSIDTVWGKSDDSNFTVLGNIYEILSTRKNRKRAGRFYTDEAIIKKIMDETVEKLDIVQHPFPKILDPACGCGYFLTVAYDELHHMFEDNLQKLQKLHGQKTYHMKCGNESRLVKGKDYWTHDNLHNHLICECLYGSDVDPIACAITKISLAAKNPKPVVAGSFNVVKSDSLIKWEEVYDDDMHAICVDGNKKCMNLNEEQLHLTKEIKKFWSQEFDVVLGNPPWVSLSRKHKIDISRSSLDYYVNNYMGSGYLDNLYEYFMERSLLKLKSGGLMSFVLPDRLCFNKSYSIVRKRLIEKYSITTLIFNISFKNVIADSMIIVIKNELPSNNSTCIRDGNKECKCFQKDFMNNHYYEMALPSNGLQESIRSKMTERNMNLGDACLTFTGFIGMKSLLTKEKEKDGLHMTYKGENIGKYVPVSCCYYPFAASNLKGGTQNMDKLGCKNKIIVRKTGRNLMAAIDDRGIIIEQSLYGLILKRKEFSNLYVLALLNSKLMNWFYKNYLITNSKSTPQIKKYNLDKLPLRIPSEAERNKMEKLVLRVMEALKKNDQASLCRISDIIDQEVFNLYQLSRAEVDFVLKTI